MYPLSHKYLDFWTLVKNEKTWLYRASLLWWYLELIRNCSPGMGCVRATPQNSHHSYNVHMCTSRSAPPLTQGSFEFAAHGQAIYSRDPWWPKQWWNKDLVIIQHLWVFVTLYFTAVDRAGFECWLHSTLAPFQGIYFLVAKGDHSSQVARLIWG